MRGEACQGEEEETYWFYPGWKLISLPWHDFSFCCQMKDGLFCISGRWGVSLVFQFISWESSALSFPPWISSHYCCLKMRMPSSKEAHFHPPEFILGVHFSQRFKVSHCSRVSLALDLVMTAEAHFVLVYKIHQRVKRVTKNGILLL